MNLIKLIIITIISVAVTSCATVDEGMFTLSEAVSSRDPVTGQRQINLVSEEQEIRDATDLTEKILTDAKDNGVDVDGEHFERVTRVFNRLIEVSHRKDLPWEVHVLDVDEWNAFTIGGGKIFVFSGMFDPEIGVQSDDELAAVLAHEIAHVTARHASEKKGKLTITKLADKSLRKDTYEASFTTIQEDEADRYSVIYSSLAGYDPKAGFSIWSRLHSASGSYVGDMLYDHPLNDDRARNLQSYATLAEEYYTPGITHQDHETLIKNNAVFSYREMHELEAGKGGGLVALFETATNTYIEVLNAKNEENKRKLKQLDQERVAAQRIQFHSLQISPAQGGGQGLFGIAINSSGQNIKEAIISITYWNRNAIAHQENLPWSTMEAFEKREFGIPLRPIQYTNVSIKPLYVQLLVE